MKFDFLAIVRFVRRKKSKGKVPKHLLLVVRASHSKKALRKAGKLADLIHESYRIVAFPIDLSALVEKVKANHL